MTAPGLVSVSSSCYVPVCVVAPGLLGKFHSFQELSAQGPHLGDQIQQRCFTSWEAPTLPLSWWAAVVPVHLPQGWGSLGYSGARWSCCTYAHKAPPGSPMTCVRANTPALRILSALVSSSPTHLLISLLHAKPPPALLLPFEIPSLAFVLYDAEALVRKLIRVIIPCTEMSLSSHSYFMFLPLDLLMLLNFWCCTTHTQFSLRVVFSIVTIIALCVRSAPDCLLIPEKDVSVLGLMLSNAIDLEWSQGVQGRDAETEEKGLDSHSRYYLSFLGARCPSVK